MAKKATITPVTDTALNAGAINTQLNAINNKLDNTLSLDGSTPNAMSADLDLNSNDILNAGSVAATSITLGGVPLSPSSVTVDASNVTFTATGATSSTNVQEELVSINLAQLNKAFHRKLHLEIPFHTPTIISMETDKGATTAGTSPIIYPQAVAVDPDESELFVSYSGDDGHYIVVRDLVTGAEKTTFFVATGTWREGIVYRKIGSARYLYGLRSTDVFRVDITTLPTNGSIITPSGADVITPEVNAFSQICWTGKTWVYMSGDAQNPGGIKVKHKWIEADEDFNKLGEIEFPIGVVGSYGEYLKDFPKGQGLAFHNGSFVVGIGGDYRPEAGGANASLTSMYNKQGLAVCSAFGDVQNLAICDPDIALSQTGVMLGRTIGVHENEGVCSAGGDLYGMWQTLTPTEWQTSLGLERGIAVTIEMDTSSGSLDYSSGASSNYHAIDQRNGLPLAVSGSPIENVIDGSTLTSFDLIIDMMIGLGLDTYRFYGTNQTITDIAGGAVSLSGSVVTFELAKNAGCAITIQSASGMRQYWVYDISGTRKQFTPKWAFGNDGDLYINLDEGADIGGAGLTGMILNSYGRLQLRTDATHALDARRGSDGYLFAFFNEANTLLGGVYQRTARTEYRVTGGVFYSGGSGSPESVITAPVGSTWSRTDGGAGTSFYVKESGTGNTGWAAK